MSAKVNSSKLYPDQLPAMGLKRVSEVLHYLPMKKSKLYAMLAKGEFVPLIKVGSMSCFRCEDIHRWLYAQGQPTNNGSAK